MDNKNAFDIISPELKERLSEINIVNPTKVQEEVISKILNKQNILFESETGTGKTLAYLLPIITNIKKLQSDENTKDIFVRLIITAPTFELASQINQTVKNITDIKSALFIGGAPIKRQTELLKEKPNIVIGTPARLVELINLKKIKTNNVICCVYDEADRLIKKELVQESSSLLQSLPKDTQKIACTATIDKKTKNFFNDLELIKLPKEDILTKKIEHWAIYAENRDKIEVLRKFILAAQPEKALIFTSRADQVENIYSKLKYKKIDCSALHAKTDKQTRKAAIDRFRSGKSKILVTSDLSARGLDIPKISHIIQLDLPQDSDFFVHRAGRTARAGKKGTNVVIGDEYEMRYYSQLEKKLGITVYPKEVRDGKIQEPKL